MILSVSRRTDIPSFYSEWFINRLKDGFVYVRNPFNANQISKVDITPEVVDCIVFWTKDPKPMMEYLDIINDMGYKYYFQFTITPYDNSFEENIRDKHDIVKTFIELSKINGKERVILRYDPIFLTDKYSIEYHAKAFNSLCNKLSNYTEKVVISFVDGYKKLTSNTKENPLKKLNTEEMNLIAGEFSEIAKSYNLSLETCAEEIDLSTFGINHTKCIDGELIERILGCRISGKSTRDGNREDCGCMKCIDIGNYDTCIHGCTYCYANANKDKAIDNYKSHNPVSPILVGKFDHVEIKERKDIKSFKINKGNSHDQINFFEI